MTSPRPPCPECGRPMRVRTAQRGPNAGNQFWGCSNYPSCKGTLNIESHSDGEESAGAEESPLGALPTRYLPVNWETKTDRNEWWSEYCSLGALPGLVRSTLRLDEDIKRSLSQCIIFSNRKRREQKSKTDEHAKLTSGLIIKLLQRGKSPHPTLTVENKSLSLHKLADRVEQLSAGEIGWKPKKCKDKSLMVTKEELLRYISQREPFSIDCELSMVNGDGSIFDSELEEKFISEWASTEIHPEAGHWFIPQAPLDRIIESSGNTQDRDRRVDFVFCHPLIPPFIVEIDGPEHADKIESDRERDQDLSAAGLEVIRVPNSEIQSGKGKTLQSISDKVRHLFSGDEKNDSKSNILSMISDCAIAAKIQYALARGVRSGWLSPNGVWEVRIDNATPTAVAAVTDFLELLNALDKIYSGQSIPNQCYVALGEERIDVISRNKHGIWKTKRCKKISATNADKLSISIQPKSSPYHVIDADDNTDFIIRPTYLPVDVLSEHYRSNTRPQIKANDPKEIKSSLETLLRHIFRKKEFREMQCNAIYNVLKQINTIVLLPTGAGKSLIYQLAGMIMPGITLVIDPLTALIQDQIESMDNMGIDRTLGIAGAIAGRSERTKTLRCAERGEYYFLLLGPEQLQSPTTRRTLETMHHEFLFNIAVIDEVHCVSEWGHDFRPSYLTVSDNIYNVGRASDQSVPPLLGLTGTASRAVLRDLLTTLRIENDNSTAVIRPMTFDRKELVFDIKKTENANSVLQAILNSLPSIFDIPPNQFFSVSDDNTQSGVIFTPHVNGDFGVLAVKSIVSSVCRSVTIYSGKEPKESGYTTNWDLQKTENAKAFKNNEVVILVATKAFGMGIDKPNIRYTIHYGMPRSLEAFYQEAGRAGRDGNDSLCTIIYTEKNMHRWNQLLDPNLSLEELRSLHKSYSSRHTNDDLMRAIWFHLENFASVDNHISTIEKVANDLGVANSYSGICETTNYSSANEMAVYRLKTLGMVNSYTIDWSERKIICEAIPFDRDTAIDSLEEYVRSTDPARAKIIRERAEKATKENKFEELMPLVRILVEYIYDDIELSRRRMIREAFLFANSVSSNEDIRQRMLSYLQEGFEYSNLEALLDLEKIDFNKFIEIANKPKLPIEADELRGMCTRLLESSPNHPGLLITRSIAESKCSDAVPITIQSDMAAAISNSKRFYRIQDEIINELLENIFSLDEEQLSSSTALALLKYSQAEQEDNDDTDLTFDVSPIMTHLFESDNPICTTIAAAWLLDNLIDQLNNNQRKQIKLIDFELIFNKLQSTEDDKKSKRDKPESMKSRLKTKSNKKVSTRKRENKS